MVLSYVLLAWAALWWFAGGTHEVARQMQAPYQTQTVLAFFAFSAVAFSLISRAVRWPTLGWLWLAVYPAAVVEIALETARGVHPFANYGWAAWLVAFSAHFWLIARHGAMRPALGEWLRAGGVWAAAIIGSREIAWWIDYAVQGRRVWPSIAWAIVPAALLAFLARMQSRTYVIAGGAPLAVFLATWTFYANTKDGDPFPLSYLPLLNPLDIALGLVFLILVKWQRAAAARGLEAWLTAQRNVIYPAYAAAGFVWANGILLRTLHHWADVPFALRPMLDSQLVQSAVSILWMLLALGAMVAATRRAIRPAWIIGAALMGIVVAKLFLVDLSGVGTVERIVSFIGVGVLMLLIGYFSPVPPRLAAS